MFFYVTLYQTKHNQKEESCMYHSICLSLSKRIKRQQQILDEESDDNNATETVSTDFAEGLKRMLSSLYGHTSNNVLSATMARKLLSHGSRFTFSHDFLNIPLKHLLDWVHNEDLEFKLKVVVNSDGDYEHVQDMFINNIIYRPLELQHICCYDMIANYELKKLTRKKIESENIDINSEKHSV